MRSVLIELGHQADADMVCEQCHGSAGKGDGSSAATLSNKRGYPIADHDFSTGNYLGGGSPEELYLRIIGGLDGTPIPLYLDILAALSESDDQQQRIYSTIN